MTSTELKIGLTNSARPSSRVLKPPGGGHTNIFAEPEVAINAPRPMYNQQNSSNLVACMGSTDPNEVVEKLREDVAQVKDTITKVEKQEAPEITNVPKDSECGEQASRSRVPPGGFSSGAFW